MKYDLLTSTLVEYSTGEGDRGKGKAKNVLDERNNDLEPEVIWQMNAVSCKNTRYGNLT